MIATKRPVVTMFCLLALCASLNSARADEIGRLAALNDIAASYGFRPPLDEGARIVLKRDYATMSFETNSRRLFYNDTLIYLNSPLVVSHGKWVLNEYDLKNVVGALEHRDSILSPSGCRLVVLDPGHGGDDNGTTGGHGDREKDLALDVAKRVAARLRACDIEVRLTRERDVFVPLDERTRIAWQCGADLFVSIHANASPDPKASGFETFIPASPGFPTSNSTEVRKVDRDTYLANRYDGASTLLGYYLQKGLLAYAKGLDRGVKHARYEVLREAPCPAALVECGFMSNRAEEQSMMKKARRDAIADGIARGILTYINRVNDAQLAKLQPAPALPSSAAAPILGLTQVAR